jgi:hypothetical protein
MATPDGYDYNFNPDGSFRSKEKNSDGKNRIFVEGVQKGGKVYHEYDEGGFKEFLAIVVGESSDNFDEATGIGEVIIRQLRQKNAGVKSGLGDKLGGSSNMNAIGEDIYNEVIKSSMDDLIKDDNKYSSRIRGATRALSGSTDMSGGAYFWNATYQKNQKEVGNNFKAYNNKVFVITAERGATTFFKYNTSPTENPGSYWKVWP